MSLSLDIITNKLTGYRFKSDLTGGIDELTAADGLIIWSDGGWSIGCRNLCTLHKNFPRVNTGDRQ
jgi:hypothetical protein